MVNVAKLREKGDVTRLLRATRRGNWDQRAEAAQALGEIGDPVAIEALVDLYTDKGGNAGVRRAAVTALEMIGSSEACDGLFAAFEERGEPGSPYPDVFAMEALAMLGDARGVRLLKAEVGKGRPDAASALGRVGDVEAVDELAKALGDQSVKMRLASVNALQAMGQAQPVESLVALLGDTVEQVRDAAGRALYEAGDRAVPALIAASTDGSHLQRSEARKILGAIRPGLEPEMQEAVNEALAVHAREQKAAVTAPFADVYDDWYPEDPDDFVRRVGSWPLNELGHEYLARLRALPPQQRLCRACLGEGTHTMLEVRGQNVPGHGALDLECPTCGNEMVFVG